MFEPMIADSFLIVLLCGVLLLAAISDRKSNRIPNLLTYSTMAIGLTYHCLTKGFNGLLFGTGGLALGIGILILPYLMGVMGAGDAKLMGAVGAILGASGVFIAFLFTSIIGGIYVLIILIIRHEYRKHLISRLSGWATVFKIFLFTRQFTPVPSVKKEKRPELPYGIAIALGTLLYLLLELSGYSIL